MNLESHLGQPDPNFGNFGETYLKNLHAEEPDIEKKLAKLDRQIKTLSKIDWTEPHSIKSQNAFRALHQNFGMHDLSTKLEQGISSRERESLKKEVKATLKLLKATKENLSAELKSSEEGSVSLKRKHEDTLEGPAFKKQKQDVVEESIVSEKQPQRKTEKKEMEIEEEGMEIEEERIPPKRKREEPFEGTAGLGPESKKLRTSSEHDQFLDLFPHSDRDEGLSDAIYTQLSLLDSTQKQLLEELISGTPKDGRKDLFLLLTSQEIPTSDIPKVIQLIGEIPDSEDRAEVVRLAESLFTDLGSWSEKLIGLESLCHACTSKGLIQIAKSFFTEEISRKEKIGTSAIISNALGNREEVILLARPFFTEEMSLDLKLETLQLMSVIPASDKEEVIRLTISLFNGEVDAYSKLSMLRAIWVIPASDREEVIHLAQFLFTKEPSDKDMSYILEAISKIPASENRAEVVRLSSFLFTEKMGLNEKLKVLEAILDIPALDREEVMRLARPLFSEEMSLYEKLDILGAISRIPSSENRTEAMRLSQSLFTEEADAYSKLSMLRAIWEIPASDREEVIRLSSSLFTEEMSLYEKLDILKTISRIPSSENRTEVMRLAQSLFTEKADGYSKSSMLRAIWEIPASDREEVIRLSSSLFTEEMSLYEKLDMLRAIWVIPASDREEVVRFARYLFTEEMSCWNKSEVLRAIRDIPVDIFRLANSLFTEKMSLSENLNVLMVDPQLAPSSLLWLADFIHSQHDELQLHEEHPLVQQAIEIISANDIPGEKNPMSLHKKLKNLREVPEDFKPGEQIVAGTVTAINMKRFQGVSLQEVKREELPKGATLEAWNRLVIDLETKMDSLPKKVIQIDNEDTEVVSPLWDEFGTTWTSLSVGSLKDPYLSGLLALSSDKVSLTEAKFRAVLSNILAKDRSPIESQAFTEQEEVLIKTAMSIQFCSGGKKEGIDGAYRDLDPEYQYQIRLSVDAQKEEEKNRAIAFITSIIKNFISREFSGNTAFMRDVTGEQGEEINQGSHQAIYLKNLIGHLVGIDHELSYDQYTGVLYDTLIQKTRKEVLEAFFKHVTPENLVREVVRAVNAGKGSEDELRKNSILVSPLISESEFWDLDEEDLVTMRLNQQGALKLLQIAGFLTE